LPLGKISGHGLSFSGGTLDKLESIPGWHCDLSIDEFKQQLREVGLVVAGQTHDLAPADGKLYALRDVTGTVESLQLIASSIMSKKIASGADVIVLDVKVGRGAFMRTKEQARQLARLMVQIGQQLGRKMAAFVTDMNQPLGLAVGNALELKEAIATLHGEGPSDFRTLVCTIAGEILRLAGTVKTSEEGQAMAAATLNDGRAWQKFRQFVAAQGGDLRYVDEPERLPAARYVEPLLAPQSGWISEIDAMKAGMTVVLLGGGRAKKGDVIDHAVGLVLRHKIGDYVEVGEPLLEIHANSPETLAQAREHMLSAYSFRAEPVQPPPLIHDVIR